MKLGQRWKSKPPQGNIIWKECTGPSVFKAPCESAPCVGLFVFYFFESKLFMDKLIGWMAKLDEYHFLYCCAWDSLIAHLQATEAAMQQRHGVVPTQLSLGICICVYVEGSWGDWGPWSECSSTCQDGVKKRSKPCLPTLMGVKRCHGRKPKETMHCSDTFYRPGNSPVNFPGNSPGNFPGNSPGNSPEHLIWTQKVWFYAKILTISYR